MIGGVITGQNSKNYSVRAKKSRASFSQHSNSKESNSNESNSQDSIFLNSDHIDFFDQRILKWYKVHGRKTLPWQQNISSYRVWVSEIMLQQTQVGTVIPYFERFMARFPNIKDLALANLDDVLHLWTGLGYYARARNLHKTAIILHTRYKGIFPSDIETIMQLPGIGRSTAGAILALSQKQRHPILDGNVKRVLCRHFAIAGFPNDPKVHNTLWELSDKLTPLRNVQHYTQAMMDLGATLCTRTNPNCDSCPLEETCLAKEQNRVALFPNKAPQKKKPIKSSILLLLHSPNENAILLEKRPSQGIWGGLWSLPELPQEKSHTSLNKNIKANLKSNLKTTLKNNLKNKLKTNYKNTFENPLLNPEQNCLLQYCLKKFSAKFNLKIISQKKLSEFRHTFTHFHLDITPILCKVSKIPGRRSKTKNTNSVKVIDPMHSEQPEQLWQSLSKPKNLGLAAPIKRLLEEI